MLTLPLRCLFPTGEDAGKLHHRRRRIFLTKDRLKREFAGNDLGERDVRSLEAGGMFHERSMTHRQLSNAAREHVYEDPLVRNDFGRSLDEFGFHEDGF